MNKPRKGLYFGKVVTYDADYDRDDSRTKVIYEDGSEGWCKHHYIDDIGDNDTIVLTISPSIGTLITLMDENGQSVTGKIIGQNDGSLIIVVSQRD